MKKLWIVLTLLAVLMLAFAGVAGAEETIAVNETKTVNISIPGDVAIYEFTPDEDGLYLFYSIHPEGDPWYALYGYLLDSDMQLITSNAFGGEDSQFRIVRQLTHDKTYYFGAAFYDKENGMTGSFPIRLEKTNHLYAAPKNGLVYTELGQPGIAEVEAYSQYGGLAYQWYDGETAISGATEPTYSFPAVPVETGSKEYRCVVTDSEDRMAEVFIQARINSGLTVYGTGGGMVEYGGDATLTVTATAKYGTDRLSYSWYREYRDEDGQWNSELLEGETEPTYRLSEITQNQEIECRVTDINGEERSYWFYVQLPRRLNASAVGGNDKAVEKGNPLTMSVTAESEYTPISYKWYKVIWHRVYDEWGEWELIPGANSSTYSIDQVFTGGEYVCQIVDGVGNDSNLYFYVDVSSPFSAELEGENGITIQASETPTLNVQVSNNLGDVTYQWFHYINALERYVPIRGATSANYTLSGTAKAGSYYCAVTDTETGELRQVWAHVTVLNDFSVEAEGETNVAVAAGGTTELKVNATGNGKLFYRWYISEYNSEYDYYYDKTIIEGANTDTLIITGNKMCAYICEVSDQYGNSQSITFYASIDNGFSVTAEDTEFIVNPGESVTLSATGTYTHGEITYRWTHSGHYNSTVVKESTESSLTIDAVGADNYGSYQLYAYDPYGNSAFYSFYISVNSSLAVTAVGETDRTINPGADVELAVTATCDIGNISYQWYQQPDNTNSGPWSYELMPLETGATLELTNVQKSKRYYCQVTNEYGREQSVYFAIRIENHLTATAVGDTYRIINPGADVELAVNATCDAGSDSISYQWYQQPDDTNGGPWSYELMPSETGATLELTNVQKSKQYYCRITDVFGGEQNVHFQIRIENHLTATAVGDTYRIINPGADVELAVNATCDAGSDSISYQWYQQPDDTNGGPWSYELMPSETGATLELTNVQKSKQYYCRITDVFGGEQNVHFQIRIENHLTANAVGETDRTINPGDDVELAVNATCDAGSDSISYQWYQQPDNTNSGPWSYELMPSETGATLELTNVQKSKQYYCRVTDEFGEEQYVNFQIKIDSGLTASAEGSNEIWVAERETATLRVTASSTYEVSISYRWETYDNTTNTLITEPVLGNREYICYVTDNYGNTVPVHFYVGVDRTASITDTYITAGESVTVNIAANEVYKNFIFIPEETAYYRFYSNAVDQDTCGDIYNAGYKHQIHDDDNGSGNNFLIEYKFIAGQKYILGARYNNIGDAGSFPVCVEIIEGLWNAYTDTYEIRTDDDGSATLHVVTEQRNAELTYTWKKLPSGEIIDQASGDTLTIDSVTQYGEYVCTVSDQFDRQRDVGFRVYVNNPGLVIGYGETQNPSVAIGEETTLQIIASGSGSDEVQYQWYKGRIDDVNLLEGETEATLTITHRSDNNEYYCCVATDQYGNPYAFEFWVYTVNGFYANTDYNETQVNAGESTTLYVNAGCRYGDIHYQWYENEISEETMLAGQQNDSLTLENVQSKKTYYCRVNDDYGNVVDLSILVKVWKDTQLTANAKDDLYDFTVEPGTTVTLTVEVSCNDDGDLNYQWYRAFQQDDGDNGYGWKDEIIEGATESIYTTGAINYREDYYCIVNDQYDNSDIVRFYIYLDNHLSANAENDQHDFTVESGTTIDLAVEASCSKGDLSYQWYRDFRCFNEGGGYSWDSEMIEGATSETYTAGARSENYYCHVEDQYGSQDDVWFFVNVDNQLTATALDGQQTYYVEPGQTADMTVVANCEHGELSYEWHRYFRQEDGNGGYYSMWETLEEAGATCTSYEIGFSEQYYCHVTDEYGNYWDVWFYLYLENGLTASAENDQYNYYVERGEAVTLKVEANCTDGELNYQWYREYLHEDDYGEYYWGSDIIEGATGTSCETYAIYRHENYRCDVTDQYGGSGSITFYIYLDNGLMASAEGSNEIWVAEGETTTLTVTASCTDGDVSYQWSGYDSTTNILETEPVYGETVYTCRVTDDYENTVTVYFYVRLDQTTELSITKISAGDTVTVDITEAGAYRYFEFIPDETAYYRFYSTADDQDTYGYIYNPGMICLNQDGYSGQNSNFLIEHMFNAGQRYILAAKYNNDSIGSFPVCFEIMEGLCRAYAYNDGDIHTDCNGSATMQVLTEQRNAELTYIWKKLPSEEIIEAADGDTLTIDSVTQYGEYMCTVSDQYGKQINVGFKLFVNNPELVINYEETYDRYIAFGETTTLPISISGNGSDAVQYQWYRDNVDNVNLIEDETGATLTVTHEKWDSECYFGVATDQYGNKYVFGFWLYTINGFRAWTDLSELQVDAGNAITLYAYVQYNEGNIRYEWYENEISDATKLADGQDNYLTLDNVQQRSTYICRVSDDFGNVMDLSILVKVWKENQFTAIAKNNLDRFTVEPGETVTLNVEASCDDGKLSYQWYRYYDWMDEIIEGATEATYTTGTINDRVDYYCLVSDEYLNSSEVRFYIHINSGLIASAEGSNEIWVTEGETVTLTVAASNMNGSENLSYYWEGSDNYTNSLTTDPIYEERYYTCHVTDEYENTVYVQFHVGADRTADLSITPIILGQPATVNITEAGIYNYFEFIPDETAYYKFYSATDVQDPYGYIYNPGMISLGGGGYGGQNSNFLIECKLNAGQRYILAAGYNYGETTGSFPVCIEIIDGLINASAYDNSIHTDYNESATMRVLTEQRNAVLTYTWRNALSGEIIEEADGDTLTIDSVTQYGEYECTVSDQYGKQIDVSFWVYVNNPDLAVFPEGSTERYLIIGEEITLKINVSGNGSDEVHYQWYDNGFNDHLMIEDETGPTLTVTHGNRTEGYYCRVTDQYGNRNDFAFYLYTVNGFNASFENGEEVQVDAGNETTLNVYAYCNEGSIHYQWYKDAISSETMLEGEQGSSLFLENVQTRNTYYCHVSDDSGNAVDLSILVKVWKDNQLKAIAEGNQDVFTVEPGVPVTMTVEASCSEGDLSYQWYLYMQYEDENGSYSWTDDIINGADAASYTPDVINRNAQYYCTVFDEYGNSIPVWFTVYVNNEFTAHALDDQNYFAVEPEATQTMTVEASCKHGELIYRWFRHVRYEDEYGNFSWRLETIEGAGGASYTTNGINKYAEYLCRVYDQYVNREDIWFYINIDNGLTVEASGGETEIYILPEQTAELQVTAHCNYGELTYQWYEHNTDNDYWEAIADATGAAYTTAPIIRYKQYYCLVNDQYGNSQQCNFYVHPDNGLVADHVSRGTQYIEPGSEITLEVDAACDVGEVTYQWYESTYDIENRSWVNEEIIEGATESSLTVTINDSKLFHCSVHDEFDNSADVSYVVYYDNKLTVRALGNANITVPYGEKAALELIASCNDGLISYQWYDEWGTEIEDATNSSYTTEPITERRQYCCNVYDQFGNGISTWFDVYFDSGLTAEPVGDYVFNVNQAPITLAVNASSLIRDASINYEWGYGDYYGQLGITSDNTYELTEPMTGKYYCNVSDGFQTKTVWFYVGSDSDAPIAYNGSDSSYDVTLGDEITLKVVAWNAENDIRYQWFGDPGNGTYTEIEGATNPDYTVTADLTRSVFCRVTGTGIEEDLWFHVRIKNQFNHEGPDIDRIQIIPNGESIQLTVNMSSALDDNLIYHWSRNGEEIDGETSNTLMVTTGGDYYVFATDRFGNQSGGDSFWCIEYQPETAVEGQKVSGTDSGRTIYRIAPAQTGYYLIETEEYCEIYQVGKSGYDSYATYSTSKKLEAGETYYAVLSGAGSTFKYTMEKEEQAEYTITLQPGRDLRIPQLLDRNGNGVSINYSRSDNRNAVSTDGSRLYIRNTGAANVTVVYENGMRRIYHITVANGNTMTMPSMLQTIEADAFNGDTGVKFIELGSNVYTVQRGAFANMGSICVIVENPDTVFESGAFANSNTVVICNDYGYMPPFCQNSGIPFLYMN